MTFDDVAYVILQDSRRTHGILTFMKPFCYIGDLSSVRSGQKDNFNRVNGKIFRCLLIGGFTLYFKDTEHLWRFLPNQSFVRSVTHKVQLRSPDVTNSFVSITFTKLS